MKSKNSFQKFFPFGEVRRGFLVLGMSLIIAGAMSTMVYSQTIPARAAFYNAHCSGGTNGTVVNTDGSVIYKIATADDLYLAANMMDATNLTFAGIDGIINSFYLIDAYYAFPSIGGGYTGYITGYDPLTCKIDSTDTFLLTADIALPDPEAVTPSTFWPWSTLNTSAPAAFAALRATFGGYNWFTPAENGGGFNKSRFYGFQATFDGGGHTISNLYLGRHHLSASATSGYTRDLTIGFIGHNTGTIKNLKLEVMKAGWSNWATGVISFANAGVIDNCTVTLKGIITSGGSYNLYAGCIVGRNNDEYWKNVADYVSRCGTVKNCTVNVETNVLLDDPYATTQIAAVCANNTALKSYSSTTTTALGTPLIQNCTVNIRSGGAINYGIAGENSLNGVIEGCTVNIEQGGSIVDKFNNGASGLVCENYAAVKNCTVNVSGTVPHAFTWQNSNTATDPAIIDGCILNVENGGVIDAAINQNTYGKVSNFTVNAKVGATVNQCPGIENNIAGGVIDSATVNITGNIIALSGLVDINKSNGSITNSTVNINGTLESSYNVLGGIANTVYQQASVKNCTVNINGTLKGTYQEGKVGGLVGSPYSTVANYIDGNRVILAANGKIDAPNGYASMLCGYVAISVSTVYYSNNTVQDLDATRSNIIGKSIIKPAYLAAFYGYNSGYSDDYYNPFNLVSNPQYQYCFDVDAGHTVSSNKDLTGTTGIESITNYELRIYPNPVRDELRIDNGELRINKVEIVDLSGKTLLSQSSNLSQINVANLPSGIYFLKIQTDKGVVTRKFVKQ